MGSFYREVVAAVLQGPANLWGAFKALVDKFGENAEGAAEYAWKNRGPSVKCAGKEYTWWPSTFKPEEEWVGKKPSDWFEGAVPKGERSVALQDAVDTVSHYLVPEEGARELFTGSFGNFHEVDDSGKSILVDNFLRGFGKGSRAELSHLGQTFAHEISESDFPQRLGREFLSKTSALRSPQDVYNVFKELLFKSVFVKRYQAMHKRVKSGKVKWAGDDDFQDLVASVVQAFVMLTE